MFSGPPFVSQRAAFNDFERLAMLQVETIVAVCNRLWHSLCMTSTCKHRYFNFMRLDHKS